MCNPIDHAHDLSSSDLKFPYSSHVQKLLKERIGKRCYYKYIEIGAELPVDEEEYVCRNSIFLSQKIFYKARYARRHKFMNER